MTAGPDIEKPIDVAVFTGAPGHQVYKTVSRLLDIGQPLNVHILVHRPARPVSRLIRNQWKNLKRHGWRWIPYQLAEIATLLMGRVSRRSNTRMTGERYTLDALVDTGKVAQQSFDTLNGAAAQSYMQGLENLQLGISLAAPILASKTFLVPERGTINLHKGKLPQYRGMPPAFWELLAGEAEVGVSVHGMEEGLDTGPLISSSTIPVERFSSAAGLRVALDELGHELVCQAVSGILAGDAVLTPQTGEGKTNTRPTLGLESKLRKTLARKEGTYGNKRLLKNLVFRSYSGVRAIARRAGVAKPSITILLYHRVSDQFRDAVTIGVESFDQQLEFLKNHYEVCALRDLIDGTVAPEGNRNLVCITFDDGYLDNYTNAAPLLLKHGLPATFFVSTGKVANNEPFEHDVQKLGYGLPNMTWDNIREMSRDGLDFGSHTVSHADLGRIPEREIIEELRQSKEAIEKELQHESVLFAFPFGQRHNFSERARDIVQELGYACCCSAYGGQNHAESWDPYRILRTGINYNFSLPALRARIHGWGA